VRVDWLTVGITRYAGSTVNISSEDLEDLRHAKRLLETTSFVARLANTVGRPVETLVAMLPAGVSGAAAAAAEKALHGALKVAVRSSGYGRSRHTNAIHKTLVGTTGAVGGAFGLAGLAFELPASTVLMLRSISEIARSEGETLDSPEAKLACLQVFALGGPGEQDDAVESGYFAIRAAMAKALAEAAEHVVAHGLASPGAPALVRFLAQVTARFGVPVSQKFVIQAVPLVGALGGATINVLFIDHFQGLARGHFIVRRLERKYGSECVRTSYAALSRAPA